MTYRAGIREFLSLHTLVRTPYRVASGRASAHFVQTHQMTYIRYPGSRS